MNVIKKAIEEVKYRIPRQLLEKVFIDGSASWREGSRTTLENQILDLVVRPRVMEDCNLVSGTEVLINLNGLTQQKPTDWMTVIHIPKDRTDGRSITTVLEVCFYSASAIAGLTSGGYAGMGGYTSGTGFDLTQTSAMTTALGAVVSAVDTIPLIGTTRADLISENTILIKSGNMLTAATFLRCILAEDENFSNIPISIYREFAKLVEFAVKAYIYNQLIIEIDTAELRFGQAVGAFKDVFSGYSDAEQNYQDQLNLWWKVRGMADHEALHRHIKLLMGTQH